MPVNGRVGEEPVLNPPCPPFSKGGRSWLRLLALYSRAHTPPFDKGGLGGILRLLAIPLFFCVISAQAGQLPAEVRQALKQAHIPEHAVGVWVQDVTATRPILAHEAEHAMSPASTMKLVTTYAALELLGPGYTWNTEVYAGGPVEGDVLKGDLILKGGGDPALTLENFWKLLRDVRQQGIREIRGNLVLDTGLYHPENGDPGAFDGRPYRPYNAGPEALLVNFKATRLRLLPEGGKVRVIADPAPAALHVDDRLQSVDGPCTADWDDGVQTAVLKTADQATVTVSGTFPASCGEKSLHLSLFANGDYVYGTFRQLWEEQGGVLRGGMRKGETPADARLLASQDSRPLAEVVYDINKHSNNVMARQLLLAIGALCDHPSTPGGGARVVSHWLASKGLNWNELVIENGSGLSRIERISPEHMGALLVDAFRSPVMPEFMASLPVASVDGTMGRRLNGLGVAAQAHVKTGSLDGVKAIAGYVLDQRGHRIAVVCVINHPNAAAGRAAQDALLEWVYAGR
jgi:D-alanyl-D-alanine carboxypeptidase/D-alanyl-D-alanine-endopeptidase (penicillin-binding protein 4)